MSFCFGDFSNWDHRNSNAYSIDFFLLLGLFLLSGKQIQSSIVSVSHK